MWNKILVLTTAAFLVAACEGDGPKKSVTSSTQGKATAETTTAAQPSSSGTATQTASLPPPTQDGLVAEVGDRVFYETDRSDLGSTARATIEGWAQWLQRYPNVTVTIEGYCDERGTREYNLALGERRAIAARNYLVALGIDPNRIGTISYGKERPVALGHTETAWRQNRRGVMVIN